MNGCTSREYQLPSRALVEGNAGRSPASVDGLVVQRLARTRAAVVRPRTTHVLRLSSLSARAAAARAKGASALKNSGDGYTLVGSAATFVAPMRIEASCGARLRARGSSYREA